MLRGTGQVCVHARERERWNLFETRVEGSKWTDNSSDRTDLNTITTRTGTNTLYVHYGDMFIIWIFRCWQYSAAHLSIVRILLVIWCLVKSECTALVAPILPSRSSIILLNAVAHSLELIKPNTQKKPSTEALYSN